MSAERVRSEGELIGVALALGAADFSDLTPAEHRLRLRASSPEGSTLRWVRDAIFAGEDPLGAMLVQLRSPAARRPLGATYTPPALVAAMVAWSARAEPVRVVDPGAGTGRFLVGAGRRFPRAELLGVEIDPLPALLLRAHVSCAGLGERVRVELRDFRSLRLSKVDGPTLFIGNPPYVRHHELGARWKAWLSASARARGLIASQLSGLHVHFFLKVAELAQAGDYGALVTAAEWLDVNYGALVRSLLLGELGGLALHHFEPRERVFTDAQATAVVACFEVGRRPRSLRLGQVDSLAALAALPSGRLVRRERLELAARWTPLIRGRRERRRGFIELGELCRVHRGQVTGANRVWICDEPGRFPPSVLFRSVTRARELFAAGAALADASRLRFVLDLPVDLDELAAAERAVVERFLRVARRAGAHDGFVAKQRRAWWAVGLREPAPILATYMARRPPAFVRNTVNARHINIAHGLYPRQEMPGVLLDQLARYLMTATQLDQGRTYAGGLVKFEPKEMERLLVPTPQALGAL